VCGAAGETAQLAGLPTPASAGVISQAPVTLAETSPPSDGPDQTAALDGTLSMAPAVAAAPPAAIPGYEILGLLGRGGMGVVYKARQLALNREVALKMLLAGPHASPSLLNRFRTEAEAVARLQHPNIVQIYEVGQVEGRPFFALEYVEGGTLAQWLNSKPQPPRQAAALVCRLARAVHSAHQRGIVHRDLKPANILLARIEDRGSKVENRADSSDPRSSILDPRCSIPKITDFGLAKQLVGPEGQTKTGEIVGTPSYMAPEQAGGVTKQITALVDVYALGAILYEMLTGRPPFLSTDPIETVLQVISDDPVSPRRLQPKLSRDLETICLKCLQKALAKRYASAEALADDLERFLDGEPILARPTGRVERLVKWARRRPGTAAGVGIGILAAAVVVGLTWFYNGQLKQERDGAVEAGRQEKVQRQKAEQAEKLEKEQRQKAETRFLWMCLAQGAQAIKEGDLMAALASFIEVTDHDRSADEIQRQRLASIIGLYPKPVQFWFHEGPVNHAEFSPDGRRVVTASSDKTARVWDVAQGTMVIPVLAHGGAVHYAAFSPNGRLVVTVADAADGHKGEVRVWDAVTSKANTAFLKHEKPVVLAVFSPDNHRVLTACEDGAARVWEVGTAKLAFAPLRHKGPVKHAAFSPDGRSIVTASADHTARIWDAATGEPVTEPLTHASPVNRAVFSPDGRLVATAYGEVGTTGYGVELWDAATGGLVVSLPKQNEPVTFVAFSPDGRQVVTANIGTAAEIWSTSTGKSLTLPLRHDGPIRFAAFSPDGRRVATASRDHTARVWDTTRGGADSPRMTGAFINLLAGIYDKTWGLAITPPLRHNDEVTSVSFSPDGRFLLTASQDGTARIWDLAAGRVRGPQLKHWGKVAQAEFSPDGRIVTASLDSTAQVWDAATGHPVGWPLWHNNWIVSASFSPDGRRVVTASADNTARVWDAQSGQPITPPLTHAGALSSAVFSPDGRRLLTTCYDGTTWIWNAATGKRVAGPMQHHGWVEMGSFSPNNRLVLTASNDQTAQVWDAATGKPVGPALRHPRPVSSAVFSPDGRRVITGGYDQKARIWDVATGKEITPPLKHNGAVLYATFSPDGKRVATASGDYTARVWDAATGEPVTPPLKHDHYVYRVAFSPNGHRLVTASNDQTARVWDAATGDPVTPPLKHDSSVNRACFSPDGRRVLTAVGVPGTSAGSAQVWELSPDLRPREDLVLLTRVLTGVRVDSRGRTIPIPRTELQAAWKSVQAKYPAEFVASTQELVTWHLREADDCENTGHRKEALVHLSRAIDAQPGEWLHYARRGYSYAELGEWDKAGADYAKAIDLGSNNYWTWSLLALVRLKQGDEVGYRNVCTSALDRLGKSTNPFTWSTAAWLSVLAARGGDLIQAKKMAQRALAELPGAYSIQRHLGAALYRLGDYQAAIVQLETAAASEQNSNKYYDWLFLAMACHRQGKHKEARQWLEKANAAINGQTGLNWNVREELALLRGEANGLVLGPWEPHAQRGRGHAERKEWSQAAAAFEKARVLKADAPRFWYRYALVHLRAGDLAAYRRACQNSAERYGSSRDPEELNWLVWTCLLHPKSPVDPAQIVQWAKRAVDLRQDSSADIHDYYNALGAAYYRAGKMDDAVRWLKAAVSAGNNAWEWFFLAMAYAQTGQMDQAGRSFARGKEWLADRIRKGGQQSDSMSLFWDFQVHAELLQEEAEKLIKTKKR
jgi:WD40 repeat protein/tetratricopeptide (TPR) repeat protein